MFPLRGQAAILRDNRPAITHLAYVAFAGVDHGFDREDHAFLKLEAAAGFAVVQHLRVFMKLLADAVAAEFAHHGITAGLRVPLNGMADIAQGGARFDLGNAAPHAFVGDVAQALGLGRGRADTVHAAGVAVVAILDGRDVQVDDVAVLQHAIAGNTVADLLVDRGADGFRIWDVPWRRVIERGRDAALYVHHVVVAEPIKFFGRDARLHEWFDIIQDFAGKSASDTHLFDVVIVFDGDSHE